MAWPLAAEASEASRMTQRPTASQWSPKVLVPGALPHRQHRAARVRVELRRIERLDGRRSDLERPGHVRAHAVLERVLPRGQPLEEEARPRVARLLVPGNPQVPLIARNDDARLQPRGARIAQVDVLGRVLRRQYDLDLDLVA